MKDIARTVAAHLLQCKAVILQPDSPFTWASGWHSPIYCDNRVTLSYPGVRDYMKKSFGEVIQNQFPGTEVIAGVATGAIAQGALVADAMNLPMVYVRASAKEHGRKNLVEGRIAPGEKVVVVEDLISTGGSSLKAVEALRESGAEVLGMVAIFSYGFQVAIDNFEKAGVQLFTLSDYHTLIEMALESGEVQQEQVEMLKQWREDPAIWNK